METPAASEPYGSCPPSQLGDPAWQIALLFPAQGSWTEHDYLSLDTNRMVEYADGCVEVLPMPTLFHQRIVRFLFHLLQTHVQQIADGEVLFAPLPVRLWSGKYREPDVVYLRAARVRDDGYPEGADLVVEVVSEGKDARKRDLETKPREYAKAGVAEYWIVDPQDQEIHVLTLDGDAYRVHGKFGSGDDATSVLLPGFSVDVGRVFSAAASPS